ncbi:hypothetical protein E4P41_06060 [Geodermatophilus sp. DF01-2]|nr:hypothetical protein E4P41_06060 [Geodermatophilus sp. DF01_2]
MDVDVFLAGWEIECCQPPPAEGDHVSWPLVWADDPSGPGALELAWSVRPVAAGAGRNVPGLLLQHGPLSAWWAGTAEEEVPGRGTLLADLHGGMPHHVQPTGGRVVRVQVVVQLYRRAGTPTYVPVAGEFELRHVTRSPRWFDEGSGGPEPRPELKRMQSGVLVGLRPEAAAG